ncbi:unnamed protein product, partial [Owenia fusiformis]
MMTITYIIILSMSLSIIGYNVNGIRTGENYVRYLMQSADVIALSEHMLFPDNANDLKMINSEFEVLPMCSSELNPMHKGMIFGQGGVAIGYRKTLKNVSHIKMKTDRIVGISIGINTINLHILSVYLPQPQCRSQCFDSVLEQLHEIVQTLSATGNIVIIGDMNGCLGNLAGTRGSDHIASPNGKKLFKFSQENSLTCVDMLNV